MHPKIYKRIPPELKMPLQIISNSGYTSIKMGLGKSTELLYRILFQSVKPINIITRALAVMIIGQLISGTNCKMWSIVITAIRLMWQCHSDSENRNLNSNDDPFIFRTEDN